MATPANPKTLQQAAAALRAEAKIERRLVNESLQRRDTEVSGERNEAGRQSDMAEQAVTSAEATLADERNTAGEFRAVAADAEKDAVAAEKRGDSAQAEELREGNARLNARAVAATARADRTETDLGNLRVELAERQRTVSQLDQQISQANKDSNEAERELDNMDNKARLLGEAGRKFAAAGQTENVVDRAQLELDAEKLLKNANAIEVDTSDIAKVTGREVQLPETTFDPPVAEADVAPADATTDASGAESSVAFDESADVLGVTAAAAGSEDDATADPTGDPAPEPAAVASLDIPGVDDSSAAEAPVVEAPDPAPADIETPAPDLDLNGAAAEEQAPIDDMSSADEFTV